ncbi:SulP family inorganic anion transporter [Candidatus Marinarcus aquaticus]|uniref:Sodium-independent anion transporter n=1 Tax=Candidatus Marinarcus aquaticus TaxID=2044504 RepID=A0A4Q0XRV9_9BACT|nr:SulP family inorganic anion transporter [Candidatus Marinarcus aquaticus]RXJ60190.1 sodium-independent anion transporter [Candidatus Marinarcus aquaticus]
MINIKETLIGSSFKNNILSPIVLCFVLIPEAVLFSIIAGVSPLIGIYTVIILSLITAILGGKAGLISGPSAAIAIIIAALSYKIKESIPDPFLYKLLHNQELSTYIFQHILVATIFAGLFQLLIGIFKLGKYIRLVPQYMIFGFVNGLAILIITTQLYLLKGESYTFYALFAGTIFILYYFSKYSKYIPVTLIALVIISSISYFFNLDTKKVGDIVNLSVALPHFYVPTVHLSKETLLIIVPYSLLIAVVGLLQSLITLCMLDEMSQKRSRDNQECIAQGAGNMACGFFGAMAGSVMLSQSMINFKNGAQGRLSTLLVSLILISFILYFSAYVMYVPLAVLLGILFMVALNILQWQNMHRIKYMSKLEKFLLIAITLITILTELHIAFLVCTFTVFIFYTMRNLHISVKEDLKEYRIKTYEFKGAICFNNIDEFKSLLCIENDPTYVILDFKNARIVDQEALDALDQIALEYKKKKAQLRIRYLSPDCKQNLTTAKAYCEYNEDEPQYKVALDL